MKYTLLITASCFLVASEIYVLPNKENLNIKIPQSKMTQRFDLKKNNMLIETIKSLKIPGLFKTIDHEVDKSTLIVEYWQHYDPLTLQSQVMQKAGTQQIRVNVLNNLSKKHSFVIIKGPANIILSLKKELKKDPLVKSIQYNYKRQLQSLTNDPLIDEAWHLDNINIQEGWSHTVGNKNIVVAIFDTGISLLHEDLKNNIDFQHAYDFAKDSNGTNGPLKGDLHPTPHGSHVAGIIGAVGNNGIGTSGVNQKITLLPIKVFRPNGGAYDSDILEAIDYVIQLKKKGINIVAINASYGGFGGNADDSPMKDAIKQLGDHGIAFFAAAGNKAYDNDRLYYDIPALPASYNLPNLIAVAATDENNSLTDFSQYGKKSVETAAPGIRIISTVDWIEGNETNSEFFYDGFENGNEQNWSTNTSWGFTQNTVHSGSYSVADSPNGNYDDYTISYILSRKIDLSSTLDQNISLDFCMYNDLSYGDKLGVFFYDQINDEYENVYVTGTTNNSWKCVGIPIEDRFKTTAFSIAIVLVPNEDGSTNDGVYIDDIKIGTYSTTNTYEYWAGTSMATPIATGAFALLSSIYSTETIYHRISRLINNGSQISLPIAGTKIDLQGSFKNPPPFLFFAKKTNTVNTQDKFTFYASNFKNPKVYLGDQEVSILAQTNDSLTIEIPKFAQNKITLSENGISNPLYISYWSLYTKTPNFFPFGILTGLKNNNLYVAGYTSDNDANIFKIQHFDPTLNEWIDDYTMQDAIFYPTGKLIDNQFFIIGGSDDNGNLLNSLYIFNLNDRSLHLGASLPESFQAGTTVYYNGSLFVIGAIGETNTINKIYKYNISQNSWSTFTTIDEIKGFAAVCQKKENTYIFGGYSFTDDNVSNKALSLNLRTGDIETLSPMPIQLEGAACSFIDDDNIMIYSGVTPNNGFNHNILVYTISENKYKMIPNSIFNNLLDRANYGSNIVETASQIFFVNGFNEYLRQTKTIEVLDKTKLQMLLETNSSVTPAPSAPSQSSGGSGGGLPIFDFWSLFLLIGGALFLLKRK